MDSRQVSKPGRPVFARGGSPRTWPRPPRRKKRGWWKPLFLLGLLFVIWHYFAIKRIQIVGARTLNPQAIEGAVKKGLKSQLLGENLITVNAGRLERSVIGEIAEIKDLSVKRRWPTLLIIEVKEREPSLAWQSGGVLYLLDRDGTTIREIKEGQVSVAVVRDESNVPLKLGARAAPSRFVGFALDVVSGLSTATGGLESLFVVETTSELNAKLGAGFIVKFDTTREAGSQLKALNLILSELSKQGKRPAEYVDLRVPGKAYYK